MTDTLHAATSHLLALLDQAMPEITACCEMSAAHGQPYEGPELHDAIEAVRARLADERVDEPAGWRCFHCGETFTSERCARLHFGRDEGSEAACVIKAGAEGSLLRALRDAEQQADDAMQAIHAECTDAAKAYHAAVARHSQALIAAEEAGYEKGLADGRALAARNGGTEG